MLTLQKQLFPLINEKSWRSLLLTDNSLQLINKRYNSPEEFSMAYEKKSIFRQRKEIAIGAINRIAHPESNPKRLYLTTNGKKQFLDFANSSELQEVMEYLQQKKGFTANTTSISQFRAISPSLVALGVTALFTWLIWMDATALEAGEEINTSGRRAGFKMLIAWIAEQLGSTNTLIVGGVVALICLYFMWKALQNPPNEVVYE